MLFYLLAFLLIFTLLLAWVSNFFGLPGNWMMLALAGIWFWFTDPENTLHIGPAILVAILLLAALGELFEFLASVLGTRKVGGERKAAVGGVIGSLVGSLVGAFIGIPIPVIGIIIGSLFFACLGALAGALIGEKLHGSDLNKSLKVGGAAFAGRLFGSLGKIALGSVILVVTITSMFI
ncbi:MAG: DUF456 domain-containing protein [Planctomycetaceae bacterium]|nr:DUF456 domain-containing protein [Planctomycetaceae bacterium]MCP4462437.1 DUF456 domain-containing protein [Planctomycetaceae bacterium]MDG1809356.1 DUF456 domain-containing protein [Pirellulaceae bacterium]MDG2104191.1 DUF456 domain-containing protein [Pirellulaceae bacterium]